MYQVVFLCLIGAVLAASQHPVYEGRWGEAGWSRDFPTNYPHFWKYGFHGAEDARHAGVSPYPAFFPGAFPRPAHYYSHSAYPSATGWASYPARRHFFGQYYGPYAFNEAAGHSHYFDATSYLDRYPYAYHPFFGPSFPNYAAAGNAFFPFLHNYIATPYFAGVTTKVVRPDGTANAVTHQTSLVTSNTPHHQSEVTPAGVVAHSTSEHTADKVTAATTPVIAETTATS